MFMIIRLAKDIYSKNLFLLYNKLFKIFFKDE